MEKKRLYILGIFFKITGYILYGIGAIGIVSAGYKVTRVGFSLELLFWAVSLLLVFIFCLAIIKIGHYLILREKKITVKYKATIFSESEADNTVLYLRSFTDDFITSKTQPAYQIRGVDLPQLTTEEEILASEFNRFGKFISAANPQTELPNAGAIQINFESREWRERIKYLMKTSAFVLVRIGEGEHLKWEIDQAMELVPPKKLLFLIPFNKDIYVNFKQRLKLDHDIEFPNLDKTVFFGIASISAIIYFDENFGSKVSICHDAGYRSSASKPFKPILRYALKPIYEQIGLCWRSPSIPKQKYVPVIFFSYLVGLCLVFALSDLSIFFSFYMVIPLHIPLLFGILGLYRTIPN
ncbi:hypothetical protein KORDIASMS9_04653 [Kordia sp. SMS9]|uniref:hypothetical protein n=1 Tax=Kordia sp. SMS9 TaxID=2282170 RepID=UPI000E0CDCC7|nr:hypothetical protein [Kordia sp. SMS9]AXG72381.1 hypothetical protein KORDIASMS9_04653 [Kordia sp. SMS9]